LVARLLGVAANRSQQESIHLASENSVGQKLETNKCRLHGRNKRYFD